MQSKRKLQKTYRVIALAVTAIASFALAATANAADSVSFADLQAAARTLGFVDSLPRQGNLLIGVVYASGDADGASKAATAARQFDHLKGPNDSIIHAVAVPANALERMPEHPNVLYLMPGVSTDSRTVSNFVRAKRLLSISSDPNCLDTKCCTLMVRAASGVDIVLDTSLADAVGVNFSSIFLMMVKRK